MSDKGIGASLHRKEDRRFLHGQGRYVADIHRPGMLEAAILRSPLAHAQIRSLKKPDLDYIDKITDETGELIDGGGRN